ncbi:MAG: malto-oligosyltrehalose synthase [Betaproteobacteria bacterium]|nr:malto-oligosyltrehalose synthase [Betaproteobacteria bacterium]
MSETRAALERLCAGAGLRADYHDIWGKRHEVADANLVALLAELGVDAAEPLRAGALAQAAQADLLEPVTLVAPGSDAWRIALRDASRGAAGALRWVIEEEGGRRHEGECPADAESLAPGVALERGYHRLVVHGAQGAHGETLLIAAPERCWRPAALDDGARVWGPALQLYALRSERNWGIGDFSDLARLVDHFAARGAALVGLNPLHALFPHNPAHVSPYSPSSRQRLNVLYLDVESIADLGECGAARERLQAPEFQARLARLRETELVDYPGVAAAKLEVLELLYANFRSRHLDNESRSARAHEFRAFQEFAGPALRRHALFESLQAHFHAADSAVWGWPVWPQAYRDHASEAVARFAAERVERVEFYEYLQWQAELQLARVGARCEALGLALGLYLDLAVSVDRAGSDAWADSGCYALGASIGAPPDDFNLKGQDWGLPPLRPNALRRARYAPFIGVLRESMRHAGALRIDHVMGLMRLFWIPAGAEPRDGAYVHYPFDELLAIVALESHRNRCLVIGEDLGTVPDEVRAALGRAGVLSYRLLYFERDGAGDFRAGADMPREALVAVSTHDLPTLAGWWDGVDLRLRQSLDLFPSDAVREAQILARAQDRVRLLFALERAGLLPEGIRPDAPPPTLDAPLAEAVHAYAAAAPARVMVLQLEDLLGVAEQANLPGTVDQHPNWRRKLPLAIGAIAEDPRVASCARRLAEIRPHPQRRAPAHAAGARVPRATYRLQFNRDFTFDDAVRVVPYLAKLGVSHVYCSPILRARAGSTHGYDIVDHTKLNPEIGGEAGFERFCAALEAQGLGQIFDMVPNHMGVHGADNQWWMDVLENGPAAACAKYFDIDWQPVNADLRGKVLLPVLGEHYGNVLDKGELVLRFEPEAGAFALRYYEHRFPIDPREIPAILRRVEALLPAEGVSEDDRAALSSLAAAFGHLPPRDTEDPAGRAERARDKEILKRRLARLVARCAAVAQTIDATLAECNAPPRESLHALLEAQGYRLAYWRVASDEINYRRFFDINELAALRMEDDEVFDATHGFALQLAVQGRVAGLRIDHPDGLFDPERYFARIQQSYARLAGIDPLAQADGRPARPLYVLAEKITARHEHVPETWALHGTTGYRFAAVVNGLFVDGSARARIDRIWRAFVGGGFTFEEAAYRGKRAITVSALASELTVLATELLRIARADRRTRDYTFYTLRAALSEVAACLPVYRTYIADKPSAQDLRYIDWAVAHATRRSRAADTSIFGFVRQVLLGAAAEGAPPELAARVLRFAMKFQQFTSPVAAKGVEDTAFYLFNRLVSLNEVGADPEVFGFTVRAFHGASSDRAARWPYTMLATSTHDNKRSEDVRQRINVISETPAAWRLLLRRWSALNRARRTPLEDDHAPSANDEYLLYQTLLGTFPVHEVGGDALEAYCARIEQYAVKAAREAKAHTSWISPNEDYERALVNFLRGILDSRRSNPFLDDLRAQADRLAWFGALNSLSMVLIKFTSPGVPDLYQGNELMDLSLVDPDNRRRVDYALREQTLDALRGTAAGELPGIAQALAAAPHDGRAKLLVTAQLLDLRRRHLLLMRDGSYAGLAVRGARAAHVVAYARQHASSKLVVIAGRLFARLLGDAQRLPLGEAVWGDTAVAASGLAEGTPLTNVLTGEKLAVRDGAIALAGAFAHFPAAAFLTGNAD